MFNYIIILQLVFALLYTPSSGISMDTWKYSSCLKKHKYNCIQKCIWNQIGIIHHNVLQINSPQFKNQYKKQLKYDSRKLKKFKKCLKKSLKHLRISKCDDIATIDSCYTSLSKDARKRVILLTAYAANKVVGAIVDPIVEGGAKMLYKFGKATLPSALTDRAELIAHNIGVVGSKLKRGVDTMKDDLISTAGHLAKNVAVGVGNLGTRVLSGANKLLDGISMAANTISNSKTAGSLSNAAQSGKEIASGIGAIGSDVLGLVDNNLAKGIDTAVDKVKKVADGSISVGKNAANQVANGFDHLGSIGSNILGYADDTLAKGIDTAVDLVKRIADGYIPVRKNPENQIANGLDHLENIGNNILGYRDENLANGIDTAADDVKNMADRSIPVERNAVNQISNGFSHLSNIGNSILRYIDDSLVKDIDTAADDVKSVADGSIPVGKSAANLIVNSLGYIGNIGRNILGYINDTLKGY